MSTSYSVETTELETSTPPNSIGTTELETSSQGEFVVGEVLIEATNKSSLPITAAKRERTVRASRSDGDAISGNQSCSIHLLIFSISIL